MVDEYGPASIFLTLSQAEYDDMKLREFLSTLQSQFKGDSRLVSKMTPLLHLHIYYNTLQK